MTEYIIPVIVFIILIAMFFSLFTGKSSPLSEYELYGEEGADGFEQRMMGLTDEEYAEYRETGHVIKNK